MPSDDKSSQTKALKAAKWALKALDRERSGGRGRRRPLQATHSSDIRAKALSIRDIAKRFKVSASSIQREMSALRVGKPNSRSQRRAGRPSTLSEAEDKALAQYVAMMSKGGFEITKKLVHRAVDDLVARRTVARPPVSKKTIARIWKSRPELHVTSFISGDITRRSPEEQAESIKAYDLLRENTMKGLDIQEADDWNADQTGILSGCVSGINTEAAATPTTEDQPPAQTADLSTRESNPRSETGFSTKELQVDYLEHFNRYSFEQSATFRTQAVEPETGKRFSLQQWFGVDECGVTSDGRRSNPETEGGMKSLPDRKPVIWRLLTLVNFTGHISIEASEYCFQFNILPMFKPVSATKKTPKHEASGPELHGSS